MENKNEVSATAANTDDNKEVRNEVYANGLTISNTFFDFCLQFKREFIYEGKDSSQHKDVDNEIIIRMSPQMAKAMKTLLEGNLDSYEKEYGSIPNFKNV
nr:MAG TPA: Protein of unknown function (DUF3467) [Caudoviricetes sp.]